MADFCDINQVWKIMTSEQYRAYLTKSIKIGAQMMYDMAEDITGKEVLKNEYGRLGKK